MVARRLALAAEHYQTLYEKQLASYARTRLPAPLGAMTAAVSAGAALAAAGESPKVYRSHWKAAAKMLGTRLKFQAKRTGYVSIGPHDWDILAAAYLAGAEGRILEIYRDSPKLFAEQLGVPRARFFERALIAVLSGDELEVTDAESEAVSVDSAHAFWIPMFEAIEAGDDVTFRRDLKDYLRGVHAQSIELRREAENPRRPYSGPLSVIGCALCAVMGIAPKLPEDVQAFVPRSAVKAALR